MTHAVFLVGINVGGVRMTMADLRETLAGAGLQEVQTVLQTGNVACTWPGSQEGLGRAVSLALEQRFAYRHRPIIYTAAALAALAEACPRSENPGFHNYVILSNDGDLLRLLLETAERVKGDDEDICAGEGCLYWHLQKGKTLATGLAKELPRSAWRGRITTRNLGTLEKMTALAS